MKIKIFFIFPIIVFLLSITNVFASDYTPYGLQIPSNSNFSYGIQRLPYRVYGNSGSTTQLAVSIYSSQGVDISQQNYIIFEVCGPSSLAFSISNSATVEAWISDKNVKYLLTNKKCSIYGSNDSDILLVYTQVGKWTVPSGGADVAYVDSYFNFNAQNVAWNWTADITNIYITNENTYQQDYANYQNIANNNTIINQNQTIINQNQATNDKLDNIDDSITSEEAPTKLDNLSDSAGWLPAGPVDSILNLPLTMFQNLSNNIGSSCTPLDIQLPYVDKNINLPCLNSIYEQIEGLSIWINSVGVIASAFILYSYLLKLYKWVDDTLTFRENNSIDNWGGI